MSNLCDYKDIFGAPNTGAHSYRLFNIAIVDVVSTFILAYIIKQFTNYSFTTISVVLFVLSIFFHKLFCVDTTITKLFFNF